MKKGGLLSLAGVFLEPCLRRLAGLLVLLAMFQFVCVTRLFPVDLAFYLQMDNPLVIVPFLLCLGATVFLGVSALDRCFTSSQGICTLMTLPMPRYRLLVAPLLAWGAMVVLLWGFQLVWVLCLYRIHTGGTLDAGLALAFDHSRLLRMLLPRSLWEGWAAVSFVVALLCGPLHLVLRRVGLGLRDIPLSKLSGDISLPLSVFFFCYYLTGLALGGVWWGLSGFLAFPMTGLSVFCVVSSLGHLYGCRAWESSRGGDGT